jgi:signal transduction histidine kinase
MAATMLAATALVVALLESRLPSGVEAYPQSANPARPELVGHPAVLGVQLATMALFAVASVGFVRHADQESDGFLRWLAAASAFAAFARLHYFLYPSLYTEWVYIGDAFRMLFYTLVLVAAVREIRSYWEAVAEAAVLEERRRLARDLHDGLAQELAYVGRNLRWADTDEEAIDRALAGTERALIESRRAIAALAEPVDRPLDAVLPRALQDVAAREHTRVALAIHPDLDVTPEERDTIVRIACEAVTNAARHGHAKLVRVAIERGRGDGLRLRVVDAGDGFEPGTQQSSGFGLASMRGRAQAVGGRFRVTSAPGRGTEVEVEL